MRKRGIALYPVRSLALRIRVMIERSLRDLKTSAAERGMKFLILSPALFLPLAAQFLRSKTRSEGCQRCQPSPKI